MKAEDLFIGAWVNYSHTEDGIAPYNEYIRISADDISRDKCIIEAHYKPILITREILKNNRFIELIYPEHLPCGYELPIREFKYVEPYMADLCNVRWYDSSDNPYVINGGPRCDVNGPKAKVERCVARYVHELQAAMKLCGIEKEIIL